MRTPIEILTTKCSGSFRSAPITAGAAHITVVVAAVRLSVREKTLNFVIVIMILIMIVIMIV